MRFSAIALAFAFSTLGCEAKKSSPEPAPASAAKPAAAHDRLVDLTASSTLAAVRTAFNAHRGEARFLTLLSPT